MHCWLSYTVCACACCFLVHVHGKISATSAMGFEVHDEHWRPRMQGVQPQMPEYRPEDMVFEMEEEKIPIYQPPKPEESDAEDDAEGRADGAEEENRGDTPCPHCLQKHEAMPPYNHHTMLPQMQSLWQHGQQQEVCSETTLSAR